MCILWIRIIYRQRSELPPLYCLYKGQTCFSALLRHNLWCKCLFFPHIWSLLPVSCHPCSIIEQYSRQVCCIQLYLYKLSVCTRHYLWLSSHHQKSGQPLRHYLRKCQQWLLLLHPDTTWDWAASTSSGQIFFQVVAVPDQVQCCDIEWTWLEHSRDWGAARTDLSLPCWREVSKRFLLMSRI